MESPIKVLVVASVLVAIDADVFTIVKNPQNNLIDPFIVEHISSMAHAFIHINIRQAGIPPQNMGMSATAC